MSEENTETQVSEDNDIKAMQAALKKANGEAAHYRTEKNLFKDRYVALATERTLSDAGITNPKVSKILDLSQVTVTESGEIEGITEQLDSLKADFPELFAPAEKRITGGADAANKKEERPQKSTAQTLVSRFNKA